MTPNKPPRLIDAFIDRLIELAAGAEPHSRKRGICEDIWNRVSRSADLFDWFVHMGLDQVNPLGDVGKPGDRWSGPRGKRRRKLCYDVAVQAMASAGCDYRGRYA